MKEKFKCVNCNEPVNAGQIYCPSCEREVTLTRLNEGIGRLSRSVQAATQLGLFPEAAEFRQILNEDRQELMRMTNDNAN